jgi:hypothetical protein
MAGMFNAAMASVSNAAARLGDTVSPPQKLTKGPTTTYDNASKDIMTKINQDMEAALQSKVGRQHVFPSQSTFPSLEL